MRKRTWAEWRKGEEKDRCNGLKVVMTPEKGKQNGTGRDASKSIMVEDMREQNVMMRATMWRLDGVWCWRLLTPSSVWPPGLGTHIVSSVPSVQFQTKAR
nr:hypothetical protein CFP56_04619 [Quercus suber]